MKKDSEQEICNGVLEEAFSLLSLEERTEQKQMAQRIYEAYENNEIALIEAGTGIGKSLAYLVPAVLWALKHQEKTIISTHTISLQEQLIHKDLPFLIKALGLDIQVMLVKGMNNYLCLRRLDDVEDSKEIDKLKIWGEKTKDGSRSSVPFPITSSTWDQVKAESDFCTHVHCPHYKQCFFFKARRKVEEAQILIVNHSLLLTQMV
ncbi:MAG TPA: DEAD/DEAH box helicase, partial [Rhabdochlamydiaceae bacterium]